MNEMINGRELVKELLETADMLATSGEKDAEKTVWYAIDTILNAMEVPYGIKRQVFIQSLRD